MNEQQLMVREFHDAVGAYSQDKPFTTTVPNDVVMLRIKLIEEEFHEFEKAVAWGDIIEIADAIADLLVVTYGAAIAYGIDMEPIFAEVHRTNMKKTGGPVRADGKILKPDGWTPPNLKPIIEQQRQ